LFKIIKLNSVILRFSIVPGRITYAILTADFFNLHTLISKLQDVNDLSFSKTYFFHFDLYKCKGRKSNYSYLILGEWTPAMTPAAQTFF